MYRRRRYTNLDGDGNPGVAGPLQISRMWIIWTKLRNHWQLPAVAAFSIYCCRRTLLTSFTRADFLYNDMVFDALAPVTSSNRGSNQNLVIARSRTQDRKTGAIFHLHCVRLGVCRPSRNETFLFIRSANYTLCLKKIHVTTSLTITWTVSVRL